MLFAVKQIFDPGSRRAWPKEDRVVKSVLKSILACVVLMMAAGLASAQTFTQINPPPCDFSDQFYADNGIVTSQLVQRFGDNNGTTRLTGPPATGSQVNYVVDSNCSVTDPTRRNFRILATTGGNSDDGNSPFTCADPNFVVPACAAQPAIPETLEFISILAFLHSQAAFESQYSRTVGAINGGLDGVQQNAGETISLTPGTDAAGETTGLNPRGISMEYIVGNFEAYAHIHQKTAIGTFLLNPCAADMVSPLAPATPCFSVADTTDSSGNVLSDVATPNLAMNWRFATNRNAMDGSDNNCITSNDQLCKHKGSFSDSPFGYFCDDLLGMWIITYFWFTQPANTTGSCAPIYAAIAAKNGFDLDGYPNILTAHELNDELEANNCGAEGQEAFDGTDGGAVWLICPAIPDPRNGAIASDAFLDHVATGSFLDTFISNNFSCLQTTGKFCFETSVE
jgi:hypothetical protein